MHRTGTHLYHSYHGRSESVLKDGRGQDSGPYSYLFTVRIYSYMMTRYHSIVTTITPLPPTHALAPYVTNGLGPVLNFCVRVGNFGEFDRSKSSSRSRRSYRSRKSFEPSRSAFRSIKVANSSHEHKIPNPNTKVKNWSQSVCHIMLPPHQ